MNSDTPSYIPPNRTSQLPENNKKVKGRTLAHTATVGEIQPRLLDLEATAAYLGIKPWTVRELEWKGILPRVRIPNGKGGELRKLLFDRDDLDVLIRRWKDREEW